MKVRIKPDEIIKAFRASGYEGKINIKNEDINVEAEPMDGELYECPKCGRIEPVEEGPEWRRKLDLVGMGFYPYQKIVECIRIRDNVADFIRTEILTKFAQELEAELDIPYSVNRRTIGQTVDATLSRWIGGSNDRH